jgi:AcrR family transcriptional regulator
VSDSNAPDAGPEDEVGLRHIEAMAGWTDAQRIAAIRAWRQASDEERPDEGLRERKKRLTRQVISDVATEMFCRRGFDEVRIAEIAEAAGVSEKTVYNYFPTKELLVFDRAEEMEVRVRDALALRGANVSPTDAILALIEQEIDRHERAGPDMQPMVLDFIRMVETTPALRAARRELSGRLVTVATEALAASAEVDPLDPEPQVAAHALVALWEVHFSARARHLRDGTPLDEMRDAVMADTRRAARLLDTGLWSFASIVQGAKSRTQLAEAAKAANEARKQVIEALRQAHGAWSDVRRVRDQAIRGASDVTWFDRKQAVAAAHREAHRHIHQAREQARADARRARSEGRSGRDDPR